MLIALELAQELAARFSLAELRRERDVADANTHPDLEDYPYWVWYHRAVEEAIDLKRLAAPTATRKRGRIDIDAVRARADILALAEGYGLKLQKCHWVITFELGSQLVNQFHFQLSQGFVGSCKFSQTGIGHHFFGQWSIQVEVGA